jgi:hypothetical protein
VLESYPCNACGAAPGKPCRTLTNRVKRDACHADRTNQAAARNWRESESAEPWQPDEI